MYNKLLVQAGLKLKYQVPCTPSSTPIGIQTRDLQIMDSTFRVPETLTLTTEPSGTSTILIKYFGIFINIQDC